MSRENSLPVQESTLVSTALLNSLDAHCNQHLLEMDVRQRLLSQPAVHFNSLVVRRLRNGVCLQGVVQVDSDGPDVNTLALSVAGVEEVLNHLVVLPTDS